jgi:putative Mn2+ efflux pump MntP
MVKRIIYCETCEREVELRRKNFDQKYHEILCFLIILTLGIGYLILKFAKKKNTCPHCETTFDLKNLPKNPF